MIRSRSLVASRAECSFQFSASTSQDAASFVSLPSGQQLLCLTVVAAVDALPSARPPVPLASSHIPLSSLSLFPRPLTLSGSGALSWGSPLLPFAGNHSFGDLTQSHAADSLSDVSATKLSSKAQCPPNPGIVLKTVTFRGSYLGKNVHSCIFPVCQLKYFPNSVFPYSLVSGSTQLSFVDSKYERFSSCICGVHSETETRRDFTPLKVTETCFTAQHMVLPC